MCLVFYGFLDFSHWCVICCTTTGTVAFLIAKVAVVFMYRHSSLHHSKGSSLHQSKGSRGIYVHCTGTVAFLIAKVAGVFMYTVQA